MKKLLTGNEGIARGVYEAGVRYAAAYPGTPSTEILENIATYKEIIAEWAPNEKVALESAIGACFVGARSFSSMKHVGVNVAADPLMSFAYMGVNGGFVLVTADEPGMHSSQNEQDNRNFASFGKMPLIEPADSAECKEYIKLAYEISEEYDVPVLFRVTTRVAHSKSVVELNDRVEVPMKEYVKDVKKTICVPGIARGNRVKLEEKINRLKEYSNSTPLNNIEWNDRKIGIISSGICRTYAKEVFSDTVSYLNLAFTYPLPDEKIIEFCSGVDEIYVIEENDPIIENHVKALGFKCKGYDFFPFTGEKTPDVIRQAFFGSTLPSTSDDSKVVGRPPTLCAGCPHRGLFYGLKSRKDTIISGDIGCYSLAFDAPYSAMDFMLCMGASFSMGHGAEKVLSSVPGNKKRVVSILGDSTFFHTGINSLTHVIYNGSNTINIILDNRITGMTGHQENPGSGYHADGTPAPIIEIEPIVKALGFKHIRTIDPNDLKMVREALDWAYSLNEPSVIITRYPCVLKKFSDEDKVEFPGAFSKKCIVEHEKCVLCKKCISTGCPALTFNKSKKTIDIDPIQCVGCEVCLQVCPFHAIKVEVK